MRIFWGLLLLLLAVTPLPIFGREDPAPPADPLIQKLLDRIDALERRVAELEGKQETAAEKAAAERASLQPATIDAQDYEPIPDIRPDYPDLQLRGFSDVNFSATDSLGETRGFSEGQFVMHLSSALSPKISFFGEVALTARRSGFSSTVERTIIRLDQSDYLKLSFGRYHTPVNLWNTSYHHGLWLQTSIDRPEMARIGGIFLPIHFVGALAEGAFPAGGLNFNYNLGLGNGRGDDLRAAGDAGDSNSHRAWVANFFVKPVRPFGLQAGGSVYRDTITTGEGRDYREWISALHFAWLRETPEFIGEFANVRHESMATGQIFDNQGFYLQVGYRLPWLENVLKPYYRYEYIDLAAGDPLFSDLSNLRASIVGVRYDLSFFAALKTEFRRLGGANGESTNGGFMQISFVF